MSISLNKDEKGAGKELSTAMNMKVPFETNIKAIRAGCEMLCRSLYVRKYNSEKGLSQTFRQLIDDLYKRGGLTRFTMEKLHAVRKFCNPMAHKGGKVSKTFLDTARLDMLFLYNWYAGETGIKIQGLQKHRFKINNTEKIVKKIKKYKAITPVEEETIKNDEDIVAYKVEEKVLFGTPTYSLLLLDVSGSMYAEKEMVIEAQKNTLEILRASEKCQQGRLFVMQHLFNDKDLLLNPLTPLLKNGKDNVKILNTKNYRPNGCTALFDSLMKAIIQLQREIDYAIDDQGKKPEINICIITDGENNCSRLYSEKSIKKQMEILKSEFHLICTSAVIGWTNGSFEMSDLEELKNDIGFDQAIAIDKSDGSAVRAAFNLWSKRLVN